MNKLILVFVAFAITTGVYAQSGSTSGKTSPQDMNNTQNQNPQNNQQDLNNNQKQNLQNNPQDLNNKQKQNLQNNPQDMDNTQKQNMQNAPGSKSHADEHKSGHDHMNPKKSNKENKENNMYLVPDSTKKKSY